MTSTRSIPTAPSPGCELRRFSGTCGRWDLGVAQVTSLNDIHGPLPGGPASNLAPEPRRLWTLVIGQGNRHVATSTSGRGQPRAASDAKATPISVPGRYVRTRDAPFRRRRLMTAGLARGGLEAAELVCLPPPVDARGRIPIHSPLLVQTPPLGFRDRHLALGFAGWSVTKPFGEQGIPDYIGEYRQRATDHYEGSAQRPRRNERLNVAACLAMVVMLAPAGLYLWYVVHFGVNVPFQDTWNGTLPLLLDFHNGSLSLGALWAPHNENRMLIPNLILVLLDTATRMNEHTDMVVSAFLLVLTALTICWLAYRTLRVRLYWLIPVPWVILGLAQVENALWAFQLAWMLILLCTALVLALIELGPVRPLFLAVALGLGLVASFSSLQGLLIWPAGLLYGLACGWRWRHVVVWMGTGVGATVVYFWHIGPLTPTPHPGYLPTHIALSARFFVDMIGAVFAEHRTILGAVILILGIATLGSSVVRSGEWRRYRLPLTLGGVGILFDLLVTEGRVQFGLSAATASRYTTYNLLLLAAVYLAVIASGAATKSAAVLTQQLQRGAPSVILLAAVSLVVLCQIGWGVPNGLYQGQAYYVNRSTGAMLLLNYENHSATLLAEYLFYPEGSYIEQWAPALKRHHWSVFAGGER